MSAWVESVRHVALTMHLTARYIPYAPAGLLAAFKLR
jgi:hypothetical protein